METEFIPYEQALDLKELGFDEPCFVFIYTGDTGNNVDHIIETKPSLSKNHNLDFLCISKPTFSQAFRWFREKYNLISNVDSLHYACELKINKFIYKIVQKTGSGTYDIYDTYEEAELECLKKLIEIVKKK
jgi:hypothetical protein